MRTHQFHVNGVSGRVAIPDVFTALQWGDTKTAFAKIAMPRSRSPGLLWVDCVALYEDQAHAGVYWHHGIHSARGATYTLFPGPDSTKEDVEACKAHCRNNFDVVRLKVVTTKRWVDAELAEIIKGAAK